MANPFSNVTTSSIITGYIQSPIILTSQAVSIPPGTKVIQALVCGGGGVSVGQRRRKRFRNPTLLLLNKGKQ